MRATPAQYRGWRPSPGIAALAAALAVLGALASCAASSDVDKLKEENRVQDQRLRSLEEGMSDALRGQFDKLNAELQDLKRVVEGTTSTINDRLDQLAAEQKKISDAGDVNQSQIRKTDRRLEDQIKVFTAYRTDAENDFDKLRLRVNDLDKLLKSPIAGLPQVTDADKIFRDAFFLLISGQLDLAIDRFGQFMQQYPKEPRRSEALFRQGQAYFLLRKYDYALVPLFQILDKDPQSKFVIEARWLLARSLEETGDLKLARDFYAQLINGKTIYSADASRRVAFMNKVLPAAEAAKPEPAKPDGAKPDGAKAEAGEKAEAPKAQAPTPKPESTKSAKGETGTKQ